MKANLGHTGKHINSNNTMLNWFTYGGLHDMSAQVAFITAQILAVLIGFVAFGAMCYGLVKFYIQREK